jgi:single-strand DNA-binding protein
MMMINKILLIGNIGKDAELLTTQSGSKFCKFTLATNERYTDSQGQLQTSTEWHTIKIWGPQGERAVTKCRKGRRCYVEGKLTSYEGNDGKKFWEIRCYTWRILDSDERDGVQVRSKPQQPQHYQYGVTTPSPSWGAPVK